MIVLYIFTLVFGYFYFIFLTLNSRLFIFRYVRFTKF